MYILSISPNPRRGHMILPAQLADALKRYKATIRFDEEPYLTLLVVALAEYHNLTEEVEYKHKNVTAEDIVDCVHKALTFLFG
jgi:hypothetical protein